MRGRADLKKLNHKGGGIPETGRINKNREALFWYDRDNPADAELFLPWLLEAQQDLRNDIIDSIIVTVKKRIW
jgi:hypothetical protein